MQLQFLTAISLTAIRVFLIPVRKADIRNPLRYLLMNRSRFQRLFNRGV